MPAAVRYSLTRARAWWMSCMRAGMYMPPLGEAAARSAWHFRANTSATTSSCSIQQAEHAKAKRAAEEKAARERQERERQAEQQTVPDPTPPQQQQQWIPQYQSGQSGQSGGTGSQPGNGWSVPSPSDGNGLPGNDPGL